MSYRHLHLNLHLQQQNAKQERKERLLRLKEQRQLLLEQQQQTIPEKESNNTLIKEDLSNPAADLEAENNDDDDGKSSVEAQPPSSPQPPPPPPAASTAPSAKLATTTAAAAAADVAKPERTPSVFILLLYYPVSRRNWMLITFNWLANALVYNGLSFYSANLNVNSFLGFFISSAVEIPSYFMGWYAMDKWGRRWVLFSTMTTGGIAGICCIFVPLGEKRVPAKNHHPLLRQRSLFLPLLFSLVPQHCFNNRPNKTRSLSPSTSSISFLLFPTLSPPAFPSVRPLRRQRRRRRGKETETELVIFSSGRPFLELLLYHFPPLLERTFFPAAMRNCFKKLSFPPSHRCFPLDHGVPGHVRQVPDRRLLRRHLRVRRRAHPHRGAERVHGGVQLRSRPRTPNVSLHKRVGKRS